jgi:16S rRNA (cytosine967-C5)-methyltransferase
MGKELDQDLFSLSFLTQPDLFLRMRPSNEKQTIQKLSDQQIPFTQIGANCLALPNASKLETLLVMDQEVVVQDASSQRIGALLKMIKWEGPKQLQFWDCCAASGGKTILVKDLLGDIDITVSDIRQSILHNLAQRFHRAGISKYHPIVTDLSLDHPGLPQKQFQLIFCDVPCTGSGTWGRTPEQLAFFKEASLKDFVQLQQKILHNVIPFIAKGGYLLFSTCSVFQLENEANTAFIQAEDKQLEIVAERYFKGYEHKADTMYAVLLRKN